VIDQFGPSSPVPQGETDRHSSISGLKGFGRKEKMGPRLTQVRVLDVRRVE
jgi:hypothetical protein